MALRVPDIGKDLRYVTDAVSQIRKALNGSVPLIGFSGSPWTAGLLQWWKVAAVRIMRGLKTLMYKEPS